MTKASYTANGFPAFSASGRDGFLPHHDYDHDGVILSAIGANCGRVYFAQGKWSCIKNTIRFWGLADIANTRFLYYATSNPKIWPRRGSAQPFISQGDARALQILLPNSISEQRNIASVLGTLDDKIASNRLVAANLESLAQLEFRSQFGGRIQGSTPLGEHVRVVRGCSYKSIDLAESDRALVTLKSIRPGGGYSSAGLKSYVGNFKREQTVKPGELVVAHTDLTQQAAVIGRPAIIPDSGGFTELIASLDLAIVRPSSSRLTVPFLYFLFLEPAFQRHAYSHANGSTVLHLNKNAIPSYTIQLPGAAAIESFDALIQPIWDMIRALHREQRTVVKIRDALLPKLISGEIRVSDTSDPEELLDPIAEELAATAK